MDFARADLDPLGPCGQKTFDNHPANAAATASYQSDAALQAEQFIQFHANFLNSIVKALVGSATSQKPSAISYQLSAIDHQ